MYALGADGGSQDVIVSNSSFTDISGGGIKLGFSGERGVPQPQNNESMPVELQDRGFLISDNLMLGIPIEFSGANPIFAGKKGRVPFAACTEAQRKRCFQVTSPTPRSSTTPYTTAPTPPYVLAGVGV